MPSARSSRMMVAVVVMVAAGFAVVNSSGGDRVTAEPGPPPERVVPPSAAADPPGPRAPGLPADDRARGVVFTGLRPGRAGGPCERLYELDDPKLPPTCTHGPDPAPPDVDVRQPTPTPQLVETTAAQASSAPPIQCYGDGVSGNRVQVIYARAGDVPDRYANLQGSFPTWAASTDAAFAESAAKTGGIRHLRWVTDPSCNLVVDRVKLSTNGDDTFDNTVAELRALGYTRTDRKYLVWVDANAYCGIAGMVYDDKPTGDNANNRGPTFARVDTSCWGLAGQSVEAHEVTHTLGAVQLSAPNTNQAGHCRDEHDRMCYDDGNGLTTINVCPSDQEALLDCNNDDYFSTSPAPTSYLASHWNAAASSFLEPVDGATPSTTTIPGATTTTAPPSAGTTIVPGSVKISTGTAAGGNAGSLSADDDNYYVVKSGTRTTSWFATFTSVPKSTSKSLRVTYTGKQSQAANQLVYMYRYSTGSWVQVYPTTTVGTTDVTVSFVPTGSPADWVSGTGQVRVRVKSQAASGALTTSADLLQVTYTG